MTPQHPLVQWMQHALYLTYRCQCHQWGQKICSNKDLYVSFRLVICNLGLSLFKLHDCFSADVGLTDQRGKFLNHVGNSTQHVICFTWETRRKWVCVPLILHLTDRSLICTQNKSECKLSEFYSKLWKIPSNCLCVVTMFPFLCLIVDVLWLDVWCHMWPETLWSK